MIQCAETLADRLTTPGHCHYDECPLPYYKKRNLQPLGGLKIPEKRWSLCSTMASQLPFFFLVLISSHLIFLQPIYWHSVVLRWILSNLLLIYLLSVQCQPKRSDTSVSPKSSSSSFFFGFIWAARMLLLPPARGAAIPIGPLDSLSGPSSWARDDDMVIDFSFWDFTGFGLSDLWGADGPFCCVGPLLALVIAPMGQSRVRRGRKSVRTNDGKWR